MATTQKVSVVPFLRNYDINDMIKKLTSHQKKGIKHLSFNIEYGYIIGSEKPLRSLEIDKIAYFVQHAESGVVDPQGDLPYHLEIIS